MAPAGCIFLGGGLARDPARLGPTLVRLVVTPYGTAQLRQNLDRFVFRPAATAGRSCGAGLGAVGAGYGAVRRAQRDRAVRLKADP